MIGSVDNKTVVFKCDECGRHMMGSTIVNRVAFRWTGVDESGTSVLRPVYVCNTCLETKAEVKNEQKKIKKIYGGK